MNKKLIIFIFLVAVIVFGILAFKSDRNPPQTVEIKLSNLNELKITSVGKSISEGVTSDKYAFKTKDNGVIQIGTERHSPPKPYLKIDKWGGEASLKVRMPFETGDNGIMIGDKIRYSTADKNRDLGFKISPLAKALGDRFDFPKANAEEPRVDIDIYPKPADEQNEDGGVEFDTILYQKPSSNQIVFPIETENLDFFYQSPLTQEYRDGYSERFKKDIAVSETQVKDLDGNILVDRPENVVGSYAVYYKDGKSGDFSQMGGKNYKAGKAFHIYRPQIIDAKGNKIWGELKADEQNNTLTITVPQEFLDRASYPVTVDPTFGYTTIGGSQNYDQYSGQTVTKATSVPALNGTLQSVTIYAYGDGTSRFVPALYADSGGSPTTLLAYVMTGTLTRTSAWGWTTTNLNAQLNAGTQYWLGHAASTGYYWYKYDSGGSSSYCASNFWLTWNNPWSGSSTTEKVSIYATYTATPAMNFEKVDMEGVDIN